MPLRPLAPSLDAPIKRRPEVLAPAGDRTTLRVALASGADAVYFGLDEGFNARARAKNFSLDNLAETVAEIHWAGARAYVTLNTLIFEVELEAVERVVRGVAEAGVDAIIVQDPAVCLMARAICPELEIHASTQMTVSSAEGARFAETLGVTRVVVPRELNVTEIADFAAKTDLELEVFIHGALCMSWSGQCLSSEAWGGRSANRGKCAQACRLPYDLMLDGEHKPLGELRYLLSPKDLAGVRAIPALMQIGVHTLKIEGRLKGPAFVATSVTGVKGWVDVVEEGRADDPSAQDELGRRLGEMMVTYSRGFGDGFLAGADHQTLVEGRFPKHRGAYLGRVETVYGRDVTVIAEGRPDGAGVGAPISPLPTLGGSDVAASGAGVTIPELRAGMGIGFDTGRPHEEEPGGPLYGVSKTDSGWTLTFGRHGHHLSRVQEGDRVWLSGVPSIARDADKLAEAGPPMGGWPVMLEVSGAAGQPLVVRASLEGRDVGASAESGTALEAATGGGIDEGLLRAKLGAFGGTRFSLKNLAVEELSTGLHLPVRELKQIRRALVEELEVQVSSSVRVVRDEAVLPSFRGPSAQPEPVESRFVPLVRTPEQLEAVIESGCPEVELDWMEMVGLGQAFDRARGAGLEVTVATVRVQKPGEEGFDRRVAKLRPDGVLIRHWGALIHFLEHPDETRPMLHGDFSLNVTNSVTAAHLLSLGLDTFTASHDLDEQQLNGLLDAVPRNRAAVTIHHHIPTFHTEHCVYSANLSEGRDYRSCGRPCDRHRVALRDREGMQHPVVVDVSCRNTVFNAAAQTAASLARSLAGRGVCRLRAEFVWESREETLRVIQAYRGLLDGSLDPAECLTRIGAHEQFGVTAGTMRTLSPDVGPTPSRHGNS